MIEVVYGNERVTRGFVAYHQTGTWSGLHE